MNAGSESEWVNRNLIYLLSLKFICIEFTNGNNI